MILAGLWYSKEKPTMQLFLKPIVEELSKLETSGKAKLRLNSMQCNNGYNFRC